MLTHRRWESLDTAELSWLRAKHHFAISVDGSPAHAALGPLLVWNDDEIAVGGGFPMHAHRDMEIITYVRQGLLGHQDTLGSSKGTIQAGDVQIMSAGTGIRHAEFNRGEVPLKLYQIWLQPRVGGGTPAWNTKRFPKSDRSGRFVVFASGFAGDEDALPIRADARVLGAMLKAGESVRHDLGHTRRAYLVAASGRIQVNGERVGPRDGVAITEVAAVQISALEDSELLMVDTG
jgi:redox-sensitive bicupin YhaK (pirin superfamily)